MMDVDIMGTYWSLYATSPCHVISLCTARIIEVIYQTCVLPLVRDPYKNLQGYI